MQALNDHLGHMLDLLPEMADFGKNYAAPLARGISDENRGKIAALLSSSIATKFPSFVPTSLAEGVTNKLVRKQMGL